MNWFLVIYLAVVIPPFMWLLVSLYVTLWRETKRAWHGS